MLKATKIKTRTYRCGFENFMIDIVETDTAYNAYIYREDCGIKSHVFGLMKCNTTLRQFKQYINNSLLESMYFYDQDIADIEDMREQKILGKPGEEAT